MALFSVGLIIKSLINPHVKTLFQNDKAKEAAVFTIVIVLWVILIKFIGFVVTSVAAYFFISWYLDSQRKNKNFKNLSISFVIIFLQVMFFYIVFARFLNVPVPHGILF